MKNGWSLSAVTARADAAKGEVASYEDVKQKIMAENSGDDAASEEASTDKLSLLDPADKAGKVLGDSIGFTIAEPGEIATDPRFQNIQVLTTSGMQKSDVERYAFDVLQIESENNGLLLLAYLNTEDPVALEQARLSASAIATLLQEIYVPSQLAAYHKMKVIYYTSLEQIARNFAKVESTETLQQATSDMFSAINAMSPVRTTIYSRYQVQIWAVI